jgi:hypothetical protein
MPFTAANIVKVPGNNSAQKPPYFLNNYSIPEISLIRPFAGNAPSPLSESQGRYLEIIFLLTFIQV